MSALTIFVVIVVISLVSITLAAALERRLVWPYAPAESLPPERTPPPSAYTTAAAEAARAAGFAPLGTFADAKGKMYRLRYDFFRAPDGQILVTVGGGTIATLPLKTTWLHTLLADGRCLITTDSQNGVEIDLAGVAEEVLHDGFGFDALLAAHRARVAAQSRPPETFRETDPLADLRAYRQERVQRLASRGYATFLDSEKNAWRYSVSGALVLAFRQYFTGLRRAVFPDRGRPVGSPLR